MKDFFFTMTFLFLSFLSVETHTISCIIQVAFYTPDLPSWQPDVPTLPHCCPFCLASSFAFVLYVFLAWLTSPLHRTCLLCIQNELVGAVLLSAQHVRQAAGLNRLLSLSAVSKFKGAFSCLALQELPELTSLIYPKVFVLLFSLFLAVHRNR